MTCSAQHHHKNGDVVQEFHELSHAEQCAAHASCVDAKGTTQGVPKAAAATQASHTNSGTDPEEHESRIDCAGQSEVILSRKLSQRNRGRPLWPRRALLGGGLD